MTSGNMANTNMVFGNIRNMASVNMLFRKGYLLAGVIMAANMFVVNEVRAMEGTKQNNKQIGNMDSSQMPKFNGDIKFYGPDIQTQMKDQDTSFTNKEDLNNGKSSFGTSLEKILYHVLKYESYINLIDGLVFSGANNYFKLWNYDKRSYWEFGCWGLRSGKFINDIFQFEANINFGRGGLWVVLHVVDFVCGNSKGYFNPLNRKLVQFVYSAVKGYISIPMTVHIPNFSFSISLDSLIFILVEKLLGVYEQKKKGEGEPTENIQTKQVESTEEPTKNA